MRGVVTLAGEGTRMLPWTRGLRKEFLPLYDRSDSGEPVLKPVAHLVLESLVSAGITEITLVVAPRDEAFVRQYFSIDRSLFRRHAHHSERLAETRRFYDTLARLRLEYARQRKPRGFGDALLRAEDGVDAEPFLLHAGDGLLLEPRRGRLAETLAAMREQRGLDVVLLVRKVSDPRRYGVVEGEPGGRFRGMKWLKVTRIEEKPERPRSHWAATAVYAFSPEIFVALRKVAKKGVPGELEVTDAIGTVIREGGGVSALCLDPKLGEWRSVGSPEGYYHALRRTEELARP